MYASIIILVLFFSWVQHPTLVYEYTIVSENEEQPYISNAPQEIQLLFVGDMMFDRTVRQYMELYGDTYIFSCISDELQRYDVVIGNLEGPITSEASVSFGASVGDPNNTRFTMPSSTAAVLAQHNIRAVSLANNHIRDFGDGGIQSTRKALDAAGIQFVGDPNDSTNISTVMSVGGITFALVGFNAFFNSYDATIEHIERYAPHMPIIVFAHWGDEYVPTNDLQRQWADAFVASGADVVLGAHPHVVQRVEYIGAVPVYYSLGNFIFDQYWNDAVTQGLMVAVTLSQAGLIETKTIPVRLGTDRRTCVDEIVGAEV